MKEHNPAFHKRISIATALLGLSLGACQTGSERVGVKVDPPTAQLAPYTTQQFDAQVGGTLDGGVVWSIEGGRTDGGSITPSGVYTAPAVIPKNNEIHVVATSAVDASKVAIAKVSIVPVPMQPTRGPAKGGTRVTIDGHDFVAGSTSVYFDGVPGADLQVDSPIRLRVTSPAHATIAAAEVKVVTPGYTQVYPNAFHYAASQLRFAGGALVDTCSGSYDLKSIDFNGDGRDDLVVSCEYESKVAFLVNDGQGGFAQPVFVNSAGYYPSEFWYVDYDGDGDKDLYVATDYNLTVLLNDGAGHFTTGPTIAYPDYFYHYDLSIAVDDFNGDGKGDIAFLEIYADTGSPNYTPAPVIKTERNLGGGVFSAPTIVAAAGQYQYSMVSGDFDGDGKADLVASYESQSPTITTGGFAFYKGNGLGAFNGGLLNPTTVYVEKLLAGDVTGDGKQDILTIDSARNVSTRAGNGAGGFAAATTIAGMINYYGGPALVDLDKDGKLDLIGQGYNAGSYGVFSYYNGGTALTTPPSFFTFTNSPYAVAAVDLDGTGSLDLIGSGYQQIETYVAGGARQYGPTSLNLGTSPNFLTERKRAGAASKGDVLVALRDGGGCLSPNTCGAIQVVPEQMGTPTTVMFQMPQKAEALRVQTVELTGDPIANDALVVDSGALNPNPTGTPVGGVWLLQGDESTGGFSQLGSEILAANPVVNDALMDDLDGDGTPDILIASQASTAATTASLEVRWGAAGAAFSTPVTLPAGTQPRRIQAAALDAGPEKSILVTDSVANQVVILKVNADRTVDPPINVNVGKAPTQVIVTDLNGDYINDLIVLATYNSDVEVDVLLGLGSLEYDLPQAYRFQGSATGMEYGDLDGDGLADLVVPLSYQSVAVLRGFDGGRFLDPQRIPAGNSPLGVTIADFNDDNLFDLAVGDQYSNTVLQLPNGSK